MKFAGFIFLGLIASFHQSYGEDSEVLANKIINSHYQAVDVNNQLDQRRVEIENQKTLLENDLSSQKLHKNAYGGAETYGIIQAESQPFSDSDPDLYENSTFESIDYQLYQERKQAAAVKAYDEKVKREYIENFKENARQQGYEVVIDDDLVVQEYRKIKD